MRIEQEQPAARGENIIPLINVVFLLLVFFLLVGTLAPTPDLDVDLPDTSAAAAIRPPGEGLYVAGPRALSYRGTMVEAAQLGAVVGRDAARYETEPLKVLIDHALKAADIAPVLQALAEAGVRRIDVVTTRHRP